MSERDEGPLTTLAPARGRPGRARHQARHRAGGPVPSRLTFASTYRRPPPWVSPTWRRPSRLPVAGCAGVPVTACSPTQAAQEIIRLATRPPAHGVDVHLCNAFTLALADREPALLRLLRRAGINFPDGKPVVWACRWLHPRYRRGPSAITQVRGADLFTAVFARGQDVGLRHYLLGSTPHVLARLSVELRRRFPSARIVGAESPPFRPLSDPERAAQSERIRGTQAQVVWLGLGTPKQDYEAVRLAAEIPAVFVAVGAAFDFVAGSKRQAPSWVSRVGLEWCFRLVCEPRRLWRRYLFGNSRFLLALTRPRRTRPRRLASGESR